MGRLFSQRGQCMSDSAAAESMAGSPTAPLREDEEFVIASIARDLSAKWRPGENPPDAYLRLDAGTVAVEISTLTQPGGHPLHRPHAKPAIHRAPMRQACLWDQNSRRLPSNNWLPIQVDLDVEGVGRWQHDLSVCVPQEPMRRPSFYDLLAGGRGA